MKRKRESDEGERAPKRRSVDIARITVNALIAEAQKPRIRRPTPIGSYYKGPEGETVIGDRSGHDSDGRSLQRDYVEPPVGYDLNSGIDSFVVKVDASCPDISPILDTLLASGQPLSSLDVVSFRNNLNKIMLTPYNDRDAWQIDGHMVRGVLFLNVCKTPPTFLHPRLSQYSYWGYSFENCATSPSVSSSGDNSAVNPNEEFCSLIATTLGSHRLCLAAEIDCKDPKKNTEPERSNDAFVELKTSRVQEDDYQKHNFVKHKLLKFWVQSFLVGVPSIVCGFRDDFGCLVRTETFKTLEVPRLARGVWDPYACLTFTENLLKWVRTRQANGDTFSLQYEPNRRMVTMTKGGAPVLTPENLAVIERMPE